MAELKPSARLRKNIEKYKAKGHWQKAASEYQKLIGFNTDDAELHKQTGDAFLKADSYTGAIRYYVEAVKLYTQAEDYDKAIGILKKILKLRPAAADVKLQVADLYVKLDKPALAIEMLEKTYEFFLDRKEKEEAVSVYRKLAALQTDNLIIQRKLAEMLEEEGQTVQAIIEYRKILKKVREMNLLTEVGNILRKIVVLEDYNCDETYELADFYYKSAAFESALDIINRVLKRNPSDTRASKSLGDVLTEQKKYDEAVRAYERYLSGKTEDRPVMEKTIKLYLQLDRPTDALKRASYLITEYLKRDMRDAAENVLSLFHNVGIKDSLTQEYFVKLLGLLGLKNQFTAELTTLIQLMTKEHLYDRLRSLKSFMDGPDPMVRITQYLTNPALTYIDEEDEEDMIDELREDLADE